MKTMKSKIIYGKYVVIDSETILPSGALYIEDDRIVDTGSYGDITKKYKADEIIGSSDMMVIPGLVNAHSHGKGITDIQFGQSDDTLETWKFRSYPGMSSYYDALWNAVLLLSSGVTTTMHHHDLADASNYYSEFTDVIRAYKDSGERVNFAPTLSNKNQFIYGDNDAFVNSLEGELKTHCQSMQQNRKKFGSREYFETVDRLYKEYYSDKVKIFHGPVSPQWVQEEDLKEIKKDAADKGIKIHIHILQTQLQRLYGIKEYGSSLMEYLYNLDFLGSDVTCGHCVWLNEKDIELLVETNTSVTNHPGCNLRVRNGITPLYELFSRGVQVAIGMDDKEISDDKDYLEELRLASKLHRINSYELDSKHILPKDIFKMGTENGASVLGFGDSAGTLDIGKQADVVLLDLNRMREPFCSEDVNIVDLLLYRGRSIDVDTVLVAGEVLLKNRELTKIDRQEVMRKLRESLPANYEEEFRKRNYIYPSLREKVAAHYTRWYEEIDSLEKKPFYHMNNRK